MTEEIAVRIADAIESIAVSGIIGICIAIAIYIAIIIRK